MTQNPHQFTYVVTILNRNRPIDFTEDEVELFETFEGAAKFAIKFCDDENNYWSDEAIQLSKKSEEEKIEFIRKNGTYPFCGDDDENLYELRIFAKQRRQD